MAPFFPNVSTLHEHALTQSFLRHPSRVSRRYPARMMGELSHEGPSRSNSLFASLEGDASQHTSENQDEDSLRQLQFLLTSISCVIGDNPKSIMENKGGNSKTVSLKYSLEDIKIHLHRVYEMVGVGFQENRDIASDIRYKSNQISFHDSRIGDYYHDLRELMGIVDIIKEEVLKMSRMSQCSHFEECSEQGALQTKEISITHPAF